MSIKLNEMEKIHATPCKCYKKNQVFPIKFRKKSTTKKVLREWIQWIKKIL